jgi:hypothetical protein
VNTLDPTRPSMQLSYSWVWTSTNQKGSETYSVLLTATRPPHAGMRWWFVCPLSIHGGPCGRRVGKLYLPAHARYFGCRHCHDLTYRSCQTSSKPPAFLRRLAVEAGLDPRYMMRTLFGPRNGI